MGWREGIDSDLAIKMVFGCVVQPEMRREVLIGGELGGRVGQAEKISRVSKAVSGVISRCEEARSRREHLCVGEKGTEKPILLRGTLKMKLSIPCVAERTNTTHTKRQPS